MADVATRKWTLEEFLDWVEDQEGVYEFDGVEPIVLCGSSPSTDRADGFLT